MIPTSRSSSEKTNCLCGCSGSPHRRAASADRLARGRRRVMGQGDNISFISFFYRTNTAFLDTGSQVWRRIQACGFPGSYRQIHQGTDKQAHLYLDSYLRGSSTVPELFRDYTIVVSDRNSSDSLSSGNMEVFGFAENRHG